MSDAQADVTIETWEKGIKLGGLTVRDSSTNKSGAFSLVREPGRA